jgi:hypothetical protein
LTVSGLAVPWGRNQSVKLDQKPPDPLSPGPPKPRPKADAASPTLHPRAQPQPIRLHVDQDAQLTSLHPGCAGRGAWSSYWLVALSFPQHFKLSLVSAGAGEERSMCCQARASHAVGAGQRVKGRRQHEIVSSYGFAGQHHFRHGRWRP